MSHGRARATRAARVLMRPLSSLRGARIVRQVQYESATAGSNLYGATRRVCACTARHTTLETTLALGLLGAAIGNGLIFLSGCFCPALAPVPLIHWSFDENHRHCKQAPSHLGLAVFQRVRSESGNDLRATNWPQQTGWKSKRKTGRRHSAPLARSLARSPSRASRFEAWREFPSASLHECRASASSARSHANDHNKALGPLIIR